MIDFLTVSSLYFIFCCFTIVIGSLEKEGGVGVFSFFFFFSFPNLVRISPYIHWVEEVGHRDLLRDDRIY